MNGQKNTENWSALVVNYFCSRNGADSGRLYLKLLNMLKKILPGEYLFRHISTCIFPETLQITGIKLLALLIFAFISCSVSSQGLHTSSNRAVKNYNEGMSGYDYLDYKVAETKFREALKEDPKFYEAYMMLGELFTKLGRNADAADSYRAAVKIDSLYYKPVFFSLANAEMKSGDYASALVHYRVYQEQKGVSEKNLALARKYIINCEFAVEAMKHPVKFSPVNIGEGINTEEDEYWPSITADGQTLMFTRQTMSYTDPRTPWTKSQEDFYISRFTEGKWSTALNAGSPLNTTLNEGAQTLASNGNYMFFTACDRPGALGSCDIFFSAYSDGKWTAPHNLNSPVNTGFWESQPSVSADGRTLFYSSSRPGGFGGKDIWIATLDSASNWNYPENAGDSINTAGDEMSPFIHFDGRTLYFSSDGHPGMGGVDLYVSRLRADSTWRKPLNMGYPLNTFNDEMGLVIESGANRAYYSTVREKSRGKDIFYFNLEENVRPDPVAYLKGKVYDRETGALIKAEYELINLTNKKVTVKSSTDSKGNFLVCLPSGFNYGVNVIKPGYLFYSESFLFEGMHSITRPYIKNIYLSRLKVGEKMILANIFYATDSWELKSESLSELDNLVDLLTANMGLAMEIGGHTDSTGTAEYNMQLSEKRALSVVNYLISRGIDKSRLKYKGYGNTMPAGDNDTSEGRQLNRRTEAKIIALK